MAPPVSLFHLILIYKVMFFLFKNVLYKICGQVIYLFSNLIGVTLQTIIKKKKSFKILYLVKYLFKKTKLYRKIARVIF